MGVDITVERTDDVPAESRVCHYDELGEKAKAAFPVLTNCRTDSVDSEVANSFRDCELVKYTEYYEISLS